jgi:hypothetical protein
MRFWFPLEDVEDLALAKALKFVCSAVGDSGLLRDTVGQFIVNFVDAGAGGRGSWYGRLQFRVRKIWPRFSIATNNNNGVISIVGVPPEVAKASPKDIARHFVADSDENAARLRYNGLLANPLRFFSKITSFMLLFGGVDLEIQNFAPLFLLILRQELNIWFRIL